MKVPSVYSAASTAAVVSRRLKAAGYQIADRSDSKRWTEGFYAFRVGYSNRVSIGYHFRGLQTPEKKAEIAAQILAAKQYLESVGYVFDTEYQGSLYILCERD